MFNLFRQNILIFTNLVIKDEKRDSELLYFGIYNIMATLIGLINH